MMASTMTTNLCLNKLRSQQRRQRREQSERVVAWADVAPPDPYEHFERKALLERALRELDSLSQAIFVYRYLDGMTLEEVAEATGKSRKTVSKRTKKIEAFVARAESAA